MNKEQPTQEIQKLYAVAKYVYGPLFTAYVREIVSLESKRAALES